ncbi:MAG: hypothetical protein AAFX56_12725 [Pseudomonadota bacterium]
MNMFFSTSVIGRHGGVMAMLAALLSLAACGGGGGGGGVQSPPPPPPPPTNNAPSRVAISDVSLNSGVDTTGGKVVGTLFAEDPDAGDTLTLSVQGGADAASFAIANDELTIDAGVLDFAGQSQYEVIVRATDGGGLTLDQTMTILVLEPQTVAVGYYDIGLNAGTAPQTAPITFNAATAVDVGDIGAATLTDIDMLFVQNPTGLVPTGPYIDPANLAKVETFVADGGVMIFHDRRVADMDPVLPGSPGTLTASTLSTSLYDVGDVNSVFADGPAGVIDNTTFDTLVNFVTFGYVTPASAPPGSEGLLLREDNGNWVTMAYPFGDGYVIYSSIPLDFYLANGNPDVARDLYAPNVVAYGLSLLTLGLDTDGDRLLDVEEAVLGTDPALADSDADGLLDRFEVRNGFDPNAAGDDTGDADGDGLNNLDEQTASTEPRVADTDGDGLSDGDEVNVHLSNPLVRDSDGDLLSDGDEVNVHMSDPILVDTDSGGTDDGLEVLEDLTNPLDPTDDVASTTLPADLNDGNGFLWDIQANGRINNGTRDAYDGGLVLRVDDMAYPGDDRAVELQGGRELRLRRAILSDLDVTRRVFVSDVEGFARFLEILENPTNAPITANVLLATNLGSDGGTVIVSTSSGDTTVDSGDRFIVSDDASNGAGDPTLAHVFAGSNGTVLPVSVTAPLGRIDFSFDIEVPAQGRAILMHFASQNADRTVAQTSADDLFNLRGEALRGMTVEEFQDVVNFDLTAATPLAVQKSRFVDCLATRSCSGVY